MESSQPTQVAQYIPVLFLLAAAVGFAGGTLFISVLLGKFAKRSKAKDAAYEGGKDPIGEADAVVHRDTELVTEFGLELFVRYGNATGGEEFKDVVRAQAAKRVAMEFVTRRIATWDHHKLAGVY